MREEHADRLLRQEQPLVVAFFINRKRRSSLGNFDMPRRSIWKGSFVDGFLLRMKKKNRDQIYHHSPRIFFFQFCLSFANS